jgi:CheY-like chemotaxis protein
MAHTLLLADDSITIQRVIELTLADTGVKVITVSDGDQAIERLRAERPDIVMLAIGLPKRDGYEVARFIQSQPALQGVPILLLSGAFDNVDDARVRESGVAGVLIKPFEPGLVINRVKELLGMSPKPAPAPGSSTVPVDDASVTSSASDERRAARPPMHEPAFAPQRAAGAVAESNSPPRHAESWDAPPNRPGADPPPSDIESPPSGGADYFDQLDAAFDTLDAQLAGRTGAPGRPQGRTAPIPRMPAAIDPGRRPSAPVSEQYVEPAPAERNPVFEVDAGWFDETTPVRDAQDEIVEAPARDHFEPAAPAAAPAAATIPAPARDTSPPVTAPPDAAASDTAAPVDEPPWYQPQPPHDAPVEQPAYLGPSPDAITHHARPVAPPSYQPPAAPLAGAAAVPQRNAAAPESAVADAFAALFAAEQGEPLPLPPAEPQPAFSAEQAALTLSDEVIERIAARVADRLTEGLLGQTVSRVVTEVSERLVREEIARIRSAATQSRT